jgi:hypothetical protein
MAQTAFLRQAFFCATLALLAGGSLSLHSVCNPFVPHSLHPLSLRLLKAVFPRTQYHCSAVRRPETKANNHRADILNHFRQDKANSQPAQGQALRVFEEKFIND